MNPFSSGVRDVDIHEVGWYELKSGVAITRLPLWDSRYKIFARLGHGDAAKLLRSRGMRLPTVDEMAELNDEALFIEPFFLPTSDMIRAAGVPFPWRTEGGADTQAMSDYRASNMRSMVWIEIHDDEVFKRLKSAAWKGEPVSNAGKHWATKNGVHVLTGWWFADGTAVQKASIAHLGEPHYTDYATTVHAVHESGPPGGVKPAPNSSPPSSRETIPPPLDEGASWSRGVDLAKYNVGLRCVLWMGYQSGLDIREIPGLKHDSRITAYSEHCRRGGTFEGVDQDGEPIWRGGLRLPLHRDEDPWCAAISSACLLACLLPGERPPHGLRVSVRELCTDARIAGTLRHKSWAPIPGCLAIEGRSGESPLRGGRGHVRRVVAVGGDKYHGIGGNERDRIISDWHSISSAIAWIDCSGGAKTIGVA